MAFVPAPDCVMVNILYYDAQITLCQNSIYFRNFGAPPTVARLNAIASVFGGWWRSSIHAALGDDIVLSVADAIDQTMFPGNVGIYFPTGTNRGFGGEVMPLNNTCRLDFVTGVPGRSYRGKNYISGIPKSRVTNGTIETGFADGLRDAYALIPDLAAANSLEWVVLSRYTAGAPRALGVMTPIIDVVLDDYTVDSWRSRLPNRHGAE